MDCLFCKIANHELESQLVFEDDRVVAFHDIDPKAPTHILIIPKEHISTANDLTPEHNALVGHMFQVAKQLAKENDIDEEGYRLLMNCNEGGGQAVFHIHLHLLGGRQMQWPPG